jgi:tryptophan-rich sensory protein
MEVKNKSYISLVIWIVALMVIGSSIGGLTKSNVDTWYMTLNRSPLTPPNYLFGIAWSILYAMIATSGWLIWSSNSFEKLKLIKILYCAQLVFNWSWTPLFFSYHLTGLALICLSLIIILVALLIVQSYKQIIFASLLLIPYLLWSIFAGYLNFYIWQYN